jgi:hypothetical protein
MMAPSLNKGKIDSLNIIASARASLNKGFCRGLLLRLTKESFQEAEREEPATGGPWVQIVCDWPG